MIGNHPLKLDCSEPGCTRCAAQIVNGELRFRVAHDGKRHEVHLPLDRLLKILAATVDRSIDEAAWKGEEIFVH